MSRRPLGNKPMTDAERQRRSRTRRKHAAAIAHRQAVIDGLRESTEREMARFKMLEPRYQLFLVDPPWPDGADAYGESGKGRAAENRYPTMTVEEMKARFPTLPAAKDALLYMYTTSTFLNRAIELLEFWGFAYGGAGGWDKQIIGKGRRHRLQLEFWIYGMKGRGLPIPIGKEKTPNFFSERRRGPHSSKPDKLADDLTRQYPGARKLEMFGRKPREGWDVFGNEAEAEAAASWHTVNQIT
jgi:N6-adenosine-specific RNA methylase IME4